MERKVKTLIKGKIMKSTKEGRERKGRKCNKNREKFRLKNMKQYRKKADEETESWRGNNKEEVRKV